MQHNSGIYKISFPNNKIYIGMTCDLQRRTKEHNTSAFSSLASDHLLPVHQAIQKYGRISIDKEVTLIEFIPPENRDKMQEREIYWIDKYSSNNKNYGYNLTSGGDGAQSGVDNPSAKLTNQDVEKITDLLINRQDIYMYQIAEEFNISPDAISNLNRGITYHNSNLTYPLRPDTTFKKGNKVGTGTNHHRSKFTEADVEQIYDMLANDLTKSLEDIGKIMNVSYATISNINLGKRYQKEGFTYPVRKSKKKLNMFQEEDIQEIYSLLKTTLSFKDIAKKKACSIDTIKRINSGQTYYHEDINYPIKKS